MRTTKTLLGPKAREAVIKGINAIYLPVRPSIGPQAKKALLFRSFNRGSRIVDDGKTISECQEPRDQFQRLAANTFKEACRKTDEIVGDGTTATTIIGGKLANTVYARLTDTSSSSFGSKSGSVGLSTLKDNIFASAQKIKDAIKKSAKKVESLEELEKIAIISVEDKELGKVIAKMAWEVGVDGFIDVVEGFKGEIETEVIRGMRFASKVPAKGFLNNAAKYEMIAKDCAVFITNYALDNLKEFSDAINPHLEKNPKVIIFAPSFGNNVLTDMYQAMYKADPKTGARIRNTQYDFFPVAVPSLRTEQLEDLAIYCGATFFDKNKGKKLYALKESDFGYLEKLVVKDVEAKEDAIAIGGKGTRDIAGLDKDKDGKTAVSTPITERVEMLKKQLGETREIPFKKLLERRIASMASAVGVIRVGDSTAASSLYRKLKIEDAVYATKSALRGGYVKGGGLCLKELAESLLEESDVLRPALCSPYEQIQASVDGGIVIGEDVLDPAEVAYYAVEHATQVVANLMTVEIITVETEDPIMGEGEFAIARALQELVINDKINKGQLRENEAEMFRDSMNGQSVEEMVSLDNG